MRAPRSRIDNYFETILGKELWISQYGDRQGVDLYLHGGDLWNRYTQSVYELNRIYDAWECRKAPTKGVIGNHPTAGNAELWKSRSGLLVMERQGLIEIIGDEIADLEVDGWKIRIHHGDILRKSAPWPHVLWTDYDPQGAEIVLLGHFHGAQGYHKINGTYFVAPGAVSRGTLRESEKNRKPACTLLTIEGKKLTINNVVIPHLPGEEVLDDQAVIKHSDVMKDDIGIDDCVETLQAMEKEEDATVSPLEILKLVRQNMIVSNEGFELACRKLQEE